MKTPDIVVEYNRALSNLDPLIASYPWENKEAYAQWLAQSYYFVRHSTRLLGVASGATPLGNDALHLRMAKHISEEFAHDRLALKDLDNLGYKITQFEELEETKIFYRNQYYGIEKFGPYYLMGYILFLEGLAISKGPDIFKKANGAFGKGATKFVFVHTEEDVDHIEKAFEQTEGLSADEQEIIIESLRMSQRIYSFIMAKLMEKQRATQIYKGAKVEGKLNQAQAN